MGWLLLALIASVPVLIVMSSCMAGDREDRLWFDENDEPIVVGDVPNVEPVQRSEAA